MSATLVLCCLWGSRALESRTRVAGLGLDDLVHGNRIQLSVNGVVAAALHNPG